MELQNRTSIWALSPRKYPWGILLPTARNVDGARPTNMTGDLLGKKSQLDLRPFGVGVPTVGRMVMP